MVEKARNDALCQQLEHAFDDAAFPGLLAAYVFGSQARGAAHRGSDLDVGVLLDRDCLPSARERFAEKIRLTSWLIGVTHHNEVDVVVLNDAPPLLARHVVTKGRRVHCANEATAHDFYRDTLLRAADVEPFLRRMAQIKLAELAR